MGINAVSCVCEFGAGQGSLWLVSLCHSMVPQHSSGLLLQRTLVKPLGRKPNLINMEQSRGSAPFLMAPPGDPQSLSQQFPGTMYVSGEGEREGGWSERERERENVLCLVLL